MADRDDNLTANIDKKEKEALESTFKIKGISGFKEKATEYVEKWRKTKVHIAFIGRSGNGKSSLINAILGKMADDPGAAETGTTETTMKQTCYTSTRYDNLVLVDLPGCGTETFPLESYLEKINSGKYDFFILVNSDRFTTDEVKLAEQLSLQKRKFYFVRTKIGQDIDNFKKSHRRHGEAEIAGEIKKIRLYCTDNIRKIAWPDMHNPPQFLVDSYAQANFDFKHLVERLIEDAPEKKRESFVLGLEGINMLGETLLMEKEKYLKKRIWKSALLSGAASAIPVPGVGESVDILLLHEEAQFFRQQLGLEEESFERAFDFLRDSTDTVTKLKHLRSNITTLCTIHGINEFLASSVASNTAENIAKFGIPIVGLVFAAAISYGATVWGLRKILEKMMKTALEMNEILNSSKL